MEIFTHILHKIVYGISNGMVYKIILLYIL